MHKMTKCHSIDYTMSRLSKNKQFITFILLLYYFDKLLFIRIFFT